MTNEMGRKETRYLQTLNCDSMAQQNLKMRPVLLKRNSLDSADFMRQPQHRRTKSQQVRFKDDGVHTETELDTNPAQDLAFTTGKTEIFRDHNFLLHWSPSFPRAQKGLRNIAIQTSPSLRKHYPVFKKKKLAVSKSLTEMPTEPSNSIQINGDLSEQDLMSSDLCYLRITDHLEDGYRNSEADSKLSERPSKAQSNGPIHSEDFSVSEKTTVSTQVPEYIHVSFPQEVENCSVSTDAPDATTNLSNSLHSSAVINNNESNENSILSSNSEKAYPCLSNSANCSECNAHSDSWEADKSDSGPLIVSKDVSSKETTPLRPPSNHNSSPCCLRDYQQAGEHKTGSSCVTLANDDHTIISLSSSNTSKSVLSCNTEIEKISAQSDVSQCNSCLEGFHIKSHPQRNEIKSQANKEISEINQNHLAHGELCALQGRLQSVEESLQSNQEKIKVLLNVIQDLEKSRALSEGFMVSDTKPLTLRVSSCHPGKICMQQSNKTQQSDVLMECYRHLQQDNYLLPARRNFYHTGQDLDNCSTCQNTACIIYSVEYDFRQQEGRFHQILKALDQAEENPAPASPQKLPTDHPDPEKKELRRKTKKMKRKCFWWI